MQMHLLQYPIDRGQTELNRTRVSQLTQTENIQAGDGLVLPEMFSTGFITDIEALQMLTKNLFTEDKLFLGNLARDKKCWIWGSSIAWTGETFQNLSLLFNPMGDLISQYAKIHPFSIGYESKHFEGGNLIVTQNIADWVFQPTICYDLRFPELYRLGLEKGVNAYIVQANWPKVRQPHWEILLKARAIENQAYVFAVNCLGQQGSTEYVGGSCIISPKGEVLAQGFATQGLLSAPIDLERINHWRKQFPALNDRKNISFYANQL